MTAPEPTVGERLRSEWPDLMATPVNVPAVWEDQDLGVTVTVTGHSRVNPEMVHGTWVIEVAGADPVPIVADDGITWTWDRLVDVIDGMMQSQQVQRELGLHRLRSLGVRLSDAEQQAIVARQERDEQVRRSLADGVPAADIAKLLGVERGRVYQIRDRKR